MVNPSGISNGMLIMALCAASLSLLFAVVSLSGYQFKRDQRPQSNAAPSPSATPIASPTQPVTEVEVMPGGTSDLVPQKIINESIRVEPGSFRAFRFEVAENMGTPKITGEVTAAGGGRDDIFLLILDDTELDNYREGKGYSSYLQTRVTDTRQISMTLPPGSYHLVLSNTHARFYPKRVKVDLTLAYE